MANIPPTQRRVPDLDDDIGGVDNLRNGTLLERNLERALEDDGLHFAGVNLFFVDSLCL
jgi:hypothetical protein